jgi:hypothetical protein
MSKGYRVTAKNAHSPLYEGTKKGEAMAAAKAYMSAHPPSDEYDSVQILPLKDGQRDWKTYSIRWVAKGLGTAKPGWRPGEGIR